MDGNVMKNTYIHLPNNSAVIICPMVRFRAKTQSLSADKNIAVFTGVNKFTSSELSY